MPYCELFYESPPITAILFVERRLGLPWVDIYRPGDGCIIFELRFIEASRETVAVWFDDKLRVEVFLPPDFYRFDIFPVFDEILYCFERLYV